MLALHAWNSAAFQGSGLWREGLVSASGFREGAHDRIASDSEEGRHLHHHSRDKASPGQERIHGAVKGQALSCQLCNHRIEEFVGRQNHSLNFLRWASLFGNGKFPLSRIFCNQSFFIV